MFLPDLKLFAKLCGVTSIGDVFLPSEKGGRRGVNGAVHKILRDVLSGKPVTKKRMVILLRAISDKAQIFGFPVSSLPDAAIDERYSSAPPAQNMLREDFTLESWYVIHQALPDSTHSGTKAHLYRLLTASQSLNKILNEGGPIALFEELNAAGDPFWRAWSSFAVSPLSTADVIPDDISEAFKVLGIIELANFYIFDLISRYDVTLPERDQILIKYLEVLFAVEGDVPNPKRAVARLLEISFEKSKYENKIDFIKNVFGDSDSEIREAKRIFSGERIPSYGKAMSALNASFLVTEDNRFSCEQFLIVSQLMARSYDYLDKIPNSPVLDANKPHFIYYEMMRAIIDRKPASVILDQ